MARAEIDEKAANRWFAVELNNAAWDMVEDENRTPEQTERMIHTAHAACWHWLAVGNVANHARAQHLLGRAYAAARLPEAADRHARRCLELVEANLSEMKDWDLPFALEGMARAHAAGGRYALAEEVLRKAMRLGEKISDPEDRQAFWGVLQSGQWGPFTAKLAESVRSFLDPNATR